MNKEELMDKWIDGLVRAISIPCSSRRKEAPFCVAAPGQDQLEPPYVGCYNMVGFQREYETFGPRPFSLHQSNNPIIHKSNQSAAPC